MIIYCYPNDNPLVKLQFPDDKRISATRTKLKHITLIFKTCKIYIINLGDGEWNYSTSAGKPC
jgi:hypothetical protein